MRPVKPAGRTDDDFGAHLRRAREVRGVSLRHIAETTKLSMRALEALERSDISLLPGGIFSRAFIRSYATEVGLDPEATVREFIARYPGDSITIGTPHEPPDVDPPSRGQRRVVLATVLLLVTAAVLFVMTFR